MGHHPRDDRLARSTTQVKILVPGDQSMVALLGQRDELLKLVEAAFDSEIVVRGNEITINGPDPEAGRVGVLFEELITLLERGHELNLSSVGRSIELIKGEEATPTQVLGDVLLTGRGRGIAPKTLGQKQYVDAMRERDRDVRDRPRREPGRPTSRSRPRFERSRRSRSRG